MTIYMRNLITVGFVAIALESSPAMAQSPLGEIAAPQVPTEIQVPAGNAAFLKGYAEGTQNYICLLSATGYSWKFTGPQATLFIKFKWINGEVRQQITTHYLSPNPSEGGTPRATWQSSLDSSAVWAKAFGPGFAVPGAIPWLLLEIMGSRKGPGGGDILTPTTFMQRVNTTGGMMPSTGCADAANVGVTAFVPYTADYFFYKARRNN